MWSPTRAKKYESYLNIERKISIWNGDIDFSKFIADNPYRVEFDRLLPLNERAVVLVQDEMVTKSNIAFYYRAWSNKDSSTIRPKGTGTSLISILS